MNKKNFLYVRKIIFKWTKNPIEIQCFIYNIKSLNAIEFSFKF